MLYTFIGKFLPGRTGVSIACMSLNAEVIYHLQVFYIFIYFHCKKSRFAHI